MTIRSGKYAKFTMPIMGKKPINKRKETKKMEQTDVLVNDEVEQVTEEIISSGIPTGVKIVAGAVGVAGLLYLGYRFVYKPIRAHIDAKREAQEILEGDVLDD
jgi:hypothetical protein